MMFDMTDTKTTQNVTSERMRLRMAYLGINEAEVARRAGIPKDSVNRIVRGVTLNPHMNTIAPIAAALNVSLEWLRGETDAMGNAGSQAAAPAMKATVRSSAPPAALATMVPVIGTVEAGAFRPVQEEIDETTVRRIEVSRHERFANFSHFAFDVHGDSMNAAGISDGDHVICVDWVQVGMLEMSGLTVVVERTINGGHLREWTVKEMEVFPDKIVLHPRSTNMIHQPIVIERNHDADNGTEIRIIALVVRVMKNVFPF